MKTKQYETTFKGMDDERHAARIKDGSRGADG